VKEIAERRKEGRTERRKKKERRTEGENGRMKSLSRKRQREAATCK
jgi:hypothetical protein